MNITLTCPNCFASLRLADRAFVGKQAGCPSCRGTIQIVADAQGARGVIPTTVGALLHGALQAAPPGEGSGSGCKPSESAPRSNGRAEGPSEPVRRPRSAPADRHVAPVQADGGKRRRKATTAAATPVPPEASASASADVPTAASPIVPPTLSTEGGAAPAAHWRQRLSSPAGLGAAAGGIALFIIVVLTLVGTGKPHGDGGARPSATAPSSESPRHGVQREPSGSGVPPSQARAVPPAAVPVEGATSPERPVNPAPAEDAVPSDKPAVAVNPPVGPPRVEGSDDSPEAAVAEVPTPSAAKPPDRPPIDVEARLRVPIARFDQTRAVPVRDLLVLVEDLAGVPVRYDRQSLGPLAAGLDRPATLRLQGTTVGGILEAIASRAGLAWDVEGESIRLRTP